MSYYNNPYGYNQTGYSGYGGYGGMGGIGQYGGYMQGQEFMPIQYLPFPVIFTSIFRD
jgi:hypothetical protein